MSETRTETTPQLSHGSGRGAVRPRHIVNLGPVGTAPKAAQTTLCGELWDRLNVQHNGEICQACVDEQRRLERRT